MSKKLQNIKAIKDMLAGKHRFQTRKSTYFGNTKTEIVEEDILEKFDDGKPKIWIETNPNGHRTKVTQHDGFKSREPEVSILKTINEVLTAPEGYVAVDRIGNGVKLVDRLEFSRANFAMDKGFTK